MRLFFFSCIYKTTRCDFIGIIVSYFTIKWSVICILLYEYLNFKATIRTPCLMLIVCCCRIQHLFLDICVKKVNNITPTQHKRYFIQCFILCHFNTKLKLLLLKNMKIKPVNNYQNLPSTIASILFL